MKLVLCTTCHRHTKAAAACDHCGGTALAELPAAPSRGLSRTAILAAGAAVAAGVACSGGTTDPRDPSPSPTPTSTSTSDPDPGPPGQALYGAVPPEEDASATPDAGEPDGAVAALYGAVAPTRADE